MLVLACLTNAFLGPFFTPQSRYDLSVEDELTIRNATPGDAGFYTCVKANDLGTAYSRAYLNIVPGEGREIWAGGRGSANGVEI